jgi:hypothetical protein
MSRNRTPTSKQFRKRATAPAQAEYSYWGGSGGPCVGSYYTRATSPCLGRSVTRGELLHKDPRSADDSSSHKILLLDDGLRRVDFGLVTFDVLRIQGQNSLDEPGTKCDKNERKR